MMGDEEIEKTMPVAVELVNDNLKNEKIKDIKRRYKNLFGAEVKEEENEEDDGPSQDSISKNSDNQS
jgi:hypothetical protein